MTADAAYLDVSLGVDQRVDDLLSRMTLPEKVGQMLQLDARGDLRDIVMNRHAGSILHASPQHMLDAIALVDKTRLRIPLLTADDAIHGHSFWPGATIFPTQLAMACSWDPGLLEKGARAAAVEIAATGLHWTFSPVLCIARELRWGRTDETFGEDPYLLGELGAAMIRGYQGDGLTDPTAVLASAKHFAGYSQTQGGRDASEADLSHRALRSWFLPPFEKAVRAGCRTVMLGYQAIDGIPVTANSWLLDDVLRGEWGFTGTLVTDWDNVGRMVWEQKICADYEEAAAVAVRAGNHLVMTTPGFFEGAQAAVASGRITESQIDDAVRRILRLKFELGLFENPRPPQAERQREVINCPEHQQINLETSRRSLVLLRNDGTLPFGTSPNPDSDGPSEARKRPSEATESASPLAVIRPASEATDSASRLGTIQEHQTIAVIGPNADDPDAQLGDWAGNSGQVPWMPDGHPRELVWTVLDGVRRMVPQDWSVVHARGADIGTLVPDPDGDTFPDGQPRPPIFTPAAADPALIEEAVQVASAADLAVVVLGDTVALTGEGKSTATLELQGGQVALMDALIDTGTPVVVVLVHSKPSVLPESVLRANALIEAFNPGMQGGRAIAELILGLIEPRGRLPISVPRHVGQQPVYYNVVRGQHGHRYADLTQDPQFAFGEGLSYTTIEYSDLRLKTETVPKDGTIRASVQLHNTGERPCLETVQLYICDVVTSVTWAEQELKGFRQVWVEPGRRVLVDVELPAADCTIVDAAGRRVVEPGEFELRVGRSSRTSDQLTATFYIR